MHNMNATVNKGTMLNSYPEAIHKSGDSVNLKTDKSQTL
jgi:hypothetical protein